MVEKNKWFAHEREKDEGKINILFFTYAGGSPSLFAPWKRFFGEEFNLYPILYPGRELRKSESIPDSLQEMVKQMTEEIMYLFEKTYVLFGHCTGNLIAFETAMYLKQMGVKEPLCMIASGAEAPNLARIPKVINEKGEMLSDKEILDNMVKFGLVDEEFAANQSFLSYYLPIYKADMFLMNHYNYQSVECPLHCPIHVCYGENDLSLRMEEVDAWKNLTDGKTTYQKFAGEHFYYKNDVKGLVDAMTSYINDDLHEEN